MRDAKGVERQIVQMDDPILGPGSSHGPSFPITMTPSGQPCTVELYLTKDSGATKAATTSPQAFTSTGAAQNVPMPALVMPTVSADYQVFIDAKMGGLLVKGFIGSDDVIIPGATVGPVTWS